jgi:hypothetical protein
MTEESLSSNIWSQRDLGVDLSGAQPVESASDADIEYVCNHSYPFMQIVDSDAVFAEGQELNFITTPSGWVVHDYGEAISVSIPHMSEHQNKENQSNYNPIVQATAAEEIAKLTAEKGWLSMEIIAGTQTMKRFLWMESKKAKFDLVGYTPSESDEKCYARLAKRAKDMTLEWERAPVQPKPQAASTAE